MGASSEAEVEEGTHSCIIDVSLKVLTDGANDAVSF